MAALLALGSALTWGVGDFLGGLASQRAHSLIVTALSQLTGLAVLLIVLPLSGVAPQADAMRWGLVAGIGGASGLLFYFRALAIGPMGVTAPLSAVVGAAVPVFAGLLLGERPGLLAMAGIALAVVATALASRPAKDLDQSHEEATAGAHRLRRGAIAAFSAGLGFGLFFIALDQAPNDAGLWPLLGARLSGLVLLSIGLAVVRPPAPLPQDARRSLGSGLLDMTANTLLLLALQAGGLLVLTSVLASLYPVGVVILAAIVLHERLSRTQLAGVVLAVVATGLIAL